MPASRATAIPHGLTDALCLSLCLSLTFTPCLPAEQQRALPPVDRIRLDAGACNAAAIAFGCVVVVVVVVVASCPHSAVVPRPDQEDLQLETFVQSNRRAVPRRPATAAQLAGNVCDRDLLHNRATAERLLRVWRTEMSFRLAPRDRQPDD